MADAGLKVTEGGKISIHILFLLLLLIQQVLLLKVV
jgi:hypothetical protein